MKNNALNKIWGVKEVTNSRDKYNYHRYN